MVDQTAAPRIQVSQGQGLIDSLQAAARYVTFLIMAVTAILGFLKTRDVAGLANYVQVYGGNIAAAVAGLIALAISGYGVFKTFKRGAQVETVAADPRVPDDVATLKE